MLCLIYIMWLERPYRNAELTDLNKYGVIAELNDTNNVEDSIELKVVKFPFFFFSLIHKMPPHISSNSCVYNS